VTVDLHVSRLDGTGPLGDLREVLYRPVAGLARGNHPETDLAGGQRVECRIEKERSSQAKKGREVKNSVPRNLGGGGIGGIAESSAQRPVPARLP
jgi:hypothetical protein